MATQKPISTISYNTEKFLREKLDAWVSAHIIQAYQYICHKGEDGDKDHIHLRIEPNKKLDPMSLSDELHEFVIGSDLPLSCRPFRPSKEEDWFLYVVHDKQYLLLKYGGGEKGEKLPYTWQDIRASEFYDVETAFIRAQATLKHSSASMATRLKKGENPLNMVLEGENVYVLNALVRALTASDYERLASDYARLRLAFDELKASITSFGFSVIEEEDGHLRVVKKSTLADLTASAASDSLLPSSSVSSPAASLPNEDEEPTLVLSSDGSWVEMSEVVDIPAEVSDIFQGYKG